MIFNSFLFMYLATLISNSMALSGDFNVDDCKGSTTPELTPERADLCEELKKDYEYFWWNSKAQSCEKLQPDGCYQPSYVFHSLEFCESTARPICTSARQFPVIPVNRPAYIPISYRPFRQEVELPLVYPQFIPGQWRKASIPPPKFAKESHTPIRHFGPHVGHTNM